MCSSNLASSFPDNSTLAKHFRPFIHPSIRSINHFFPASSFKLTILLRTTFSAVLSLSSAK